MQDGQGGGSGDKTMERREFVRVNAVVPVRYAFLDMNGQRLPPGLSEGATTNLSASGMLLQGRLGDLAWVQPVFPEAGTPTAVTPSGSSPLRSSP